MCVTPSACKANLERPKSETLASMRSVNKILLLFTSRWIMLGRQAMCRYSKPENQHVQQEHYSWCLIILCPSIKIKESSVWSYSLIGNSSLVWQSFMLLFCTQLEMKNCFQGISLLAIGELPMKGILCSSG